MKFDIGVRTKRCQNKLILVPLFNIKLKFNIPKYQLVGQNINETYMT